MLRITLIHIILLFLPIAALVAVDGALPANYIKNRDAAQLDKHPERHLELAQWCKKQGMEEQYKIHWAGFHRHLLAKEQAKLKGEPKIADRKRFFEIALKGEMDPERDELRRLWIAAEFAEQRPKVKEGDLAGLGKLLDWLADRAPNEEALILAKEIIALAPDHEKAHRALGEVKLAEGWKNPWEMLVARNGLKDLKARYQLHKELSEVRKQKDAQRVFPAKPMAGVPMEFGLNRVPIADGQPDGSYFCHIPSSYKPGKPMPLLVYLHGGGTGGIPESISTASNNLGNMAGRFPDKGCILIAPILRVHSVNSWNVGENMAQAVDAIRDIDRRCNIDRTRIWLAGTSMGGQGTGRFSFVIPETFAAFCPMAGAYYASYPAPDLTGKPFLVLQGALDTKFRNDSLVTFLAMIRAANATVEYHMYPDAGHGLPSDAEARMFAFFAKQPPLDYAPDLDLVRRLVIETVKEKPDKHD